MPVSVVVPEVGKSVELVLGAGDDAMHVLATVLETTADGIVLGKFDGPEAVKLPEIGLPLRLRFHLRDSGYEFDTLCLHRRETPYRFLYVARPTEVTRRQMRAYLRVDCEIPITVIRLDDPRRTAITGMIQNLSGGGMLVALMVAVPPESRVEVRFDLDEDQTIANVTARVLSIRAGDDGSKVHVLNFEGIDDEQRTSIIRHTFRLQHKLAKAARTRGKS